MLELEELVRAELERELPLPSGKRANWDDVVQRAGGLSAGSVKNPRASWGHRFGLASVIALTLLAATVSPVRGAILDGFDGFSAWISGEPGSPASRAEQAAFDRANQRSWTGFPPGTQLRRLIATSAGETNFTLFGFRSGDMLCLRLVASGGVSRASTHCIPLSALQQTSKPAVVAAADEAFGDTKTPPYPGGYSPALAAATFGIASDGVANVILRGDDGRHDARVESNAFLYVADHPKLGARVRGVDAVAVDGTRVALPFSPAPFGTIDLPQPSQEPAKGPSRVERAVKGGSIGWLMRREERGDPLPAALRDGFSDQRDLKFGRILRPDPASDARIVVAELSRMRRPPGIKVPPDPQLCVGATANDRAVAIGCSPLAQMFERAPFTVGMSGSGSDQFTRLYGIASDDVAKINIYLANGDVLDVALKDNVYLSYVSRAGFPIRMVGYDGEGRIISVETFRDDGMTNPAPPAARTSMRERFSVTAEDGTKVVVIAGDAAGGYRCWQIRYGTNGAEGGGCTPWPLTPKLTLGNPLNLIGTQSSGPDSAVFLAGQVPEEISRVTASFPDGRTEEARTEDGYSVYAVRQDELRAGGVRVVLRGYDASGNELATRGVTVRR